MRQFEGLIPHRNALAAHRYWAPSQDFEVRGRDIDPNAELTQKATFQAQRLGGAQSVNTRLQYFARSAPDPLCQPLKVNPRSIHQFIGANVYYRHKWTTAIRRECRDSKDRAISQHSQTSKFEDFGRCRTQNAHKWTAIAVSLSLWSASLFLFNRLFLEQRNENCQDIVRKLDWSVKMISWMQDLRYSMRQLRKSPGFTITAVLTLAMAIGANAVVFSVMNGLILRPLNVPEAKSLYGIERAGDQNLGQSYPDYLDVRDRNRRFDGVAGYSIDQVAVDMAKNHPWSGVWRRPGTTLMYCGFSPI